MAISHAQPLLLLLVSLFILPALSQAKFQPCNSHRKYPVKVSDVKISPDPVKRSYADDATITITGVTRVDKKHLMRSKTYGYDRIKDLSEDVLRLKKISRWRLIWRKIMMTNQLKKNQNIDHRVRYDPFTYSQNFENDGTIAYHDDPDVSSKSFSTRFVGSSKVFNLNYT